MPEGKSSKSVEKETTQKTTEVTTGAPAASGAKTNGLAIAAIILALIPGLALIGLILAIIALAQIKSSKEGGKGLAIGAIIISVVYFVLGIALAGIFIFAAQKAVKDAGLNVDTKNGSVSLTDKEGGTVSVGNVKLPDGFPSDVPIYKPSEAVLSLKVKDGFNVTLVTDDSAQQVVDFYKAELSKNGWKDEDASIVFGVGTASTYTKGDQQLLVYILSDPKTPSANGKKTSINLTTAKKTSTSSSSSE